MRFITITLIVHAADPVTGAQVSTADRFREVIDSALLAEELGFDGFGVGERHERPFISSSPTVTGPAWNCSSPTSRRYCAASSPTRHGDGAAGRRLMTPCRPRRPRSRP
jgi:hypothetical protein